MQIRLGAPAITSDGDQIGRVERLFIDPSNLAVQEIVVGGRLPTGARRRVPFRRVVSPGDQEDGGVRLALSTDAVNELPAYVEVDSAQRGSGYSGDVPRLSGFGDLSAPQVDSGQLVPGPSGGSSASPSYVILSRSTDLFSREGRNLGHLAGIECNDDGQLLELIRGGRIFQYRETRVSAGKIASCSSLQIHIALNANELQEQMEAPAEERDVERDETARVESIMSAPQATASADDTIRHAMRRMEAEGLRGLFVEDDEGFLGVVSELDLRRLTDPDLDRTVGGLVQTDIPQLNPTMTLPEAREHLTEMPETLDRLPVVDQNQQLVGVVLRRALRARDVTDDQSDTTAPDEQATGEIEIEAGMKVEEQNGRQIGRVERVVHEDGTVTAMVISHGLFGRRRTELGVEHIEQIMPGTVRLAIGRREFRLLPELET